MKHTPRINTTISVKIKKQTQDRIPEGQRIAPRLGETRQSSDELLTTQLTVNLRAQD